MGARDLRTLWSRLVPHPCLENHVPKKFQVLDHVKPPVWNPGPKNWDPTPWKSRLKSFQVSILETASVKIQAAKLRSQVLKTMSWKPYPKISQAPKLRSQVLNFLGLFGSWKPRVQTPGLQKLRIPRPENHVQKIYKFGSWKPTPCMSQNWNLTSWKSCP